MRIETAIHFQILLTSKTSKSSQNPHQVEMEKRNKTKPNQLLHNKLYLSKPKTGIRCLKYENPLVCKKSVELHSTVSRCKEALEGNPKFPTK